MRRQELEELLQESEDLCNDHAYITYKIPKVLEQLSGVKKVPKDLRDRYDNLLEELGYVVLTSL